MKRWRSGCDGMIAVNSIFASLAVGLLALVVALADRSPLTRTCVLLLLIAFLMFAHASETITDAVERDDVLMYQRSHVKYNLGVVLPVLVLGVAIAFGLNPEKVERFRKERRAAMRLVTGVTLIIIAVLMYAGVI